jgi:Na+/H+ antiporter NhaD/arsenite permease-like protein
LLVIWVSAIASGIVENIPFTVAALPVADYLTSIFPGAAESKIIYWALILGADLGGNATYLGSAPNIVAVGLLTQAGYRLSFWRFMRDGIPVTIITLLVASIWLLTIY